MSVIEELYSLSNQYNEKHGPGYRVIVTLTPDMIHNLTLELPDNAVVPSTSSGNLLIGGCEVDISTLRHPDEVQHG